MWGIIIGYYTGMMCLEYELVHLWLYWPRETGNSCEEAAYCLQSKGLVLVNHERLFGGETSME